MTTYGITATGFVAKTLTDLVDEIKTAERSTISSTLNLLSTSVLGQINGIFADRLSELWDLAEAVYRAAYPDSASGEALDQVCSYTGVERLAATTSTVTLDRLYLDTGTTIPVGSVVSVGTDGARFVLLEEVANATGAQGTFSGDAESEDTGPIVGTSGTIDTIQTPIAGWLDTPGITCAVAENYAVDSLTLTLKLEDGAVQTVSFPASGGTWTAAAAATEIENDTTGLTASDEGGYVRIVTDASQGSVEITGGTANAVFQFPTAVVKGFNSTDATEGTDEETDADLRSRRESLLRAQGSGTVEALRARILDIDGVLQCIVQENTTDVTNADGLPPHSFEAIVRKGTATAADIAECIWDNKAAGIETYAGGTTTHAETVTDTMGITHTINFSEPDEKAIDFAFTVLTDSDFPADGSDQIKAAVVAYADDNQNMGDDVIALRYNGIPFDIAGVIDVTAFTLNVHGSPPGTSNITISTRELATIDTADITVTVTP